MRKKEIKNIASFCWREDIGYITLPGGSDGKESACSLGDPGSIPGLGRSPAEGNGNPLQYSCLENSMDKGSLAGYSSWSRKELDMINTFTFRP